MPPHLADVPTDHLHVPQAANVTSVHRTNRFGVFGGRRNALAVRSIPLCKISGVSQLAVVYRASRSRQHCLRVTLVLVSFGEMQSLIIPIASTSITVPMSLLRRRHGSWRLRSARSSLELKFTLSRHAQHFQGSLGRATSTGAPIAVLQNVTALTCLGTFKSSILASGHKPRRNQYQKLLHTHQHVTVV